MFILDKPVNKQLATMVCIRSSRKRDRWQKYYLIVEDQRQKNRGNVNLTYPVGGSFMMFITVSFFFFFTFFMS